MQPLPLVLGSVVVNLLVVALGVVLLAVGFRSYRFGRVIRDTPTAKPGSVAAGRAEVEGVARPYGDFIEAPFTGEECLCLDWRLEEALPEGDGYDWVERAADRRIEPFYVEGDSGRVLVRADEHPDPEELPWEYDSRRFDASESDEVEAFLDEYRRERGENPAVTADPAVTENPAVTEDPVRGRGETGTEVRWRYVKRLVPPGKGLYVFGSVEPQHGYGESGFVTDETTGQFVIGRTNEHWAAAEAYWLGLLAFAAGILFVLWGGSVALGPLADLA